MNARNDRAGGPLFSVTVEAGRDVEAHVVVDSLLDGTSSGGVRIVRDVHLGEIRALAAEMTLKYNFIGLRRGGAKCGIRLPEGLAPVEKFALLAEVGRKLSAIIRQGIYNPGMDMNCGPDELRAIYRGAGFSLGNLTDTSFFTAVSVDNALRACRACELKAPERPLTVAVEGFGNVAAHLALRLPPREFRIVAVSTVRGAVYNEKGYEAQTLGVLRRRLGDAFVDELPGEHLEPKESLLTLPVDVLVPAARILVIHDGNMNQVQARYVVPAANAPYTPAAAARLHERGIMALPGFVCNSGGVYGSSLLDSGVSLSRIEDLSTGLYRAAVAALVRKSRELNLSPTDIAGSVALSRLARRQAVEPGSGKALLKRLYRRGLYPRSLYGRRVGTEFERNLKRLLKRLEHFRLPRENGLAAAALA